MLPLHLLSILFCAVLVAGQPSGGDSSSGEEEEGLCLSCEEVAMLCMKDTALGAKMATAFSQCMDAPAASRTLDVSSLRQRPQGKGKGKGKGKQPPPSPSCPTFNQTMTMIEV
jgi:hypothetical protein